MPRSHQGLCSCRGPWLWYAVLFPVAGFIKTLIDLIELLLLDIWSLKLYMSKLFNRYFLVICSLQHLINEWMWFCFLQEKRLCGSIMCMDWVLLLHRPIIYWYQWLLSLPLGWSIVLPLHFCKYLLFLFTCSHMLKNTRMLD